MLKRRPTIPKRLATGLITMAFVGLNACGGDGWEPIKIVHASVEPNPVPAPSVGQPSAFVIKWRVKNRQRYSIRISVINPSEPGSIYPVQEGCDDCDNKLVTMSCTVSVVNPQIDARDLRCERDLDPSINPRPQARVGAYNWNFHVQESSNPFFGGIDDKEIVVEFK